MVRGSYSERIEILKRKILEEPVHLSCERLKFLLDIYKYNGDQNPPLIKRAKLLDQTLSNITISIDENPIVGSLTQYIVGALPFPEWSCNWMLEDSSFPTGLGPIVIEEEDKPLLEEAVQYWRDKGVWYKSNEMIRQKYPNINNVKIAKCGVWDNAPPPFATVNCILNYRKLLEIGLNDLIEGAKKTIQVEALGDGESHKKINFLNSLIISLNAATKFARRYASLAEDMAEHEGDEKRKAELNEIGKICKWVPANPARSFKETIQSFWFGYLMAWFEGAESVSAGRFSQYIFPYYERDRKSNIITEEKAIELIEFLFLKMMSIQLFSSMDTHKSKQGTTAQNLSLGGLTSSGADATNEIDFLVLEALRRVKTIQPSISVLYHNKMSERFLFKCAEVIKETGLGLPQFYNYAVLKERAFSSHGGISFEDARDMCCIGCQETVIPGKTYFQLEGILNAAKMIELALFDGVDPLSNEQIGPKTGNSGKFTDYADLHEAVLKQMQFFLPLCREFSRVGFNYMAEITPMPFQSALVDGCIESGKDIYEGGAKYNVGGVEFIGVIDLANSLCAVKKLVFDEKVLSMEDLLESLRLNFEGWDEVHRLLLDTPRYGNDDDYADQFVKDWYEILWEEHQRARLYQNKTVVSRPEAFSVTVHFSRGRLTGALPCGRKARLPLTDASVSPMPGTDRNGPTALINSVTKVLDTVKWGSSHLNMKFHPFSFESRDKIKNFLTLLKVYMDLGGGHVQFNCVSNKTLKDAQVHPEKHRDLVIRVAGFSAYFIYLDKEVQEEIIKRTEIGI